MICLQQAPNYYSIVKCTATKFSVLDAGQSTSPGLWLAFPPSAPVSKVSFSLDIPG